MAKTTCAKFTYAGITSGGDGSEMVYTGGTMLDDYLAKAEINEERTNEKEYADGHQIDNEAIPTGVQMIMELVNNNDNIRTAVLGMAAASNAEGADLLLTEADPPFVGAGCLLANRYKGTVTWEGYWLHKVQFTSGGISAETRRDRTTWQHETINGNGVGVRLSASGPVAYYAYKGGMTEAAATAWLKGHAGIST